MIRIIAEVSDVAGLSLNAPVRQRVESDAAAWINSGRQKPFLQPVLRASSTVVTPCLAAIPRKIWAS
jgi:hypothetical protein